ncbi:MAG TPA: hypothetical protein VNW25_02050 [Candidatus Sulfotelmatobacter sp.]|nr:hypothetical protein [Candidatus Sulfotelmatobacter sp.]
MTTTAKMLNRNPELLTVEHLAYLPATHPSLTYGTRDDLSVLVMCVEENL